MPTEFKEKRISFRFETEVVLTPWWYDQEWFTFLVETMSEEEALKDMLISGFDEDWVSIFQEMLHVDNMPMTGKDFIKLVTNVKLVEVELEPMPKKTEPKKG